MGNHPGLPGPRGLSENSICALKPGEIGEIYGRKTLAIPPILSIQMLFSDSLLDLPERVRTQLNHFDAAMKPSSQTLFNLTSRWATCLVSLRLTALERASTPTIGAVSNRL